MNPLDLFPKAKQPTAEGDSTTTPGTAGDGTTTDAEPSADRNPNRSSTTRDGQCVNCRRQAPDHTAPAPRNRHRAKGTTVSNRDPKLSWGPFGAPRMRENPGVVARRRRHFHGAGEAVKLFDAGSRFEGLRIVATSTRVRLFIFPAGSRG